MTITRQPEDADAPATLKRALSLPLLVLYGLGVTIGAGIYVLIGATAGRAGVHAPLAFVLAAVVMSFSACTFAELAGRFPVSAGEAAYVAQGLRSPRLALLTGLLVIAAALVSSAAISIGCAGYLMEFLALPEPLLVAGVVLLMGLIAAWGVLESVTVAALLTLLEIGGLLVIIVAGIGARPEMFEHAAQVLPAADDRGALFAVMGAGLLAFFAFIGFEDLVNLAEETHAPARNMPRAIFLTLAISTVIYMLVTYVAVFSGPLDELGASRAPLGLVFERTTGWPADSIAVVAILATVNGVIVQMVMAARVIYGLARQGNLPALFARVEPRTRTPLVATVTVVMLVLVCALLLPLQTLAEMTSRVILLVFCLVNLSLLRLKLAACDRPDGVFRAPIWVPGAGLLSCLALLLSDLVL
ncbi:MAG: amino acid permease [Gammaproteobacteria bacterium]|nr:amino acid permease [Gammaproteobacteria bacterium]